VRSAPWTTPRASGKAPILVLVNRYSPPLLARGKRHGRIVRMPAEHFDSYFAINLLRWPVRVIRTSQPAQPQNSQTRPARPNPAHSSEARWQVPLDLHHHLGRDRVVRISQTPPVRLSALAGAPHPCRRTVESATPCMCMYSILTLPIGVPGYFRRDAAASQLLPWPQKAVAMLEPTAEGRRSAPLPPFGLNNLNRQVSRSPSLTCPARPARSRGARAACTHSWPSVRAHSCS
jgi:hypothetical protein